MPGQRPICSPLLRAAWTLLLVLPGAADPALSAAGDKQKSVIPFDLVSKFDNGRYGQMVGEAIWKKLEREKGFVIPENMGDVRDWCASKHLQPGPDTEMDQMKQIVQQEFGADIGIWGSVERAPGAETDVYDLVIKCVDFSAPGDPKVIYQCSARTKVVSEIPHVYVKQMLDALYERKPGAPPPADPIAEANWKKNPNLVVGGDFEKGSGGVPNGWESRGGQLREPLGRLVSWVAEEGNPGNHLIRFEFDKALGNSFGVMYYSKPFPIQEGAAYRFQCRYRTNGPEVKVFIKCYDEMPTQYQGATEVRPAVSRVGPKGSPRAGNDPNPEAGQQREAYRSQQNLKGPKNQWNTHTEDFTPKHTKYTPRSGRVMLLAYKGAGVVEFDDVVLKQITPASPGEKKSKDLRHSLETKVTIKEMDENERRSRAEKERERLRGQQQPKP